MCHKILHLFSVLECLLYVKKVVKANSNISKISYLFSHMLILQLFKMFFNDILIRLLQFLNYQLIFKK